MPAKLPLLTLLAAAAAFTLPLSGCARDDSAQASATPRVALADLAFGPMKNLGTPLLSRMAIHYVVTTLGDDPVLCTTVSGNPAKFSVFNLETGELAASYDMPKGGSAWAHAVDSKGNVYVAGYLAATLYRFSPADKTFTELGRLFGETAALAITVDDADNIYIGTYPNAKLIKYDAASGQLSDLGRRLPRDQYLKSLVYHDGYLYGGGAMKSDPEFVRIKLATMEQETLPPPPRVKDLTSYYYANAAGGKLFFYLHSRLNGNTEGARALSIYDPAASAWLDFELKDYQGLVVSEPVEGKVYLPAAGKVWTYELATGALAETGWAWHSSFRGSSVVSLRNRPGFADPSLVNLTYTDARISLLNTRTGQAYVYPNRPESSSIKITAMAFLDDSLLLGAYMGTEAARYDTRTDRVAAVLPMGQPESIFTHGDRAWFGVYPSASIEEFDPAKPAARGSNPRELFQLKNRGQSRPFGLAVTDDYIVAATIADYGAHDGSLAVQNRATGKLDVHAGIVPKQSLCAVHVDGDTVYAGSTIWGGLGAEPVATAAQVVRFSLKQGKVLATAAPAIPGGGKPAAVGGLVTGPDGRLWGVAYGTVFVMDPVTLRTLRTIEIERTNWNNQHLLWRGFDIRVDPHSGLIIANPGSTLVAIDPATYAVKKLLPAEHDRAVALADISPVNGDLYFTLHRSRDVLQRLRRMAPAE